MALPSSQAIAADLERLEALASTDLFAADRAWVQARLEETGAREETAELIQHFSRQSVAALEALPPSPFRDSMENLVDLLARRSS